VRLYIGEVKKEVGRTLQDTVSEIFHPLMWEGEKVLFAQPVKVEMTLTNCGSEILVLGRLSTVLLLSCSRCLEPFLHPLKVEFRLELRNVDRLHRPSDVEAEAEETDEIRYFCENDTYIDVTQDIEELILVNLPMKPLCRPDCLGICPRCGTNLDQGKCSCEEDNLDPRLAVLKTWKAL